MADVLKKAKDLWDKSRIAEVPGKTLEGLNLIDKAAGLPVKTAANLAGIGEHVPEGLGAQVDTAFGLPGRAATGFNAAVPPGLSQQAGQATTELTGSPLAGGVVGLGVGLVEPVPSPGKIGAVSEISQLTTKLLDRIGNRAVVSRQFIEDLAKAPDLKGPEKEAIARALEASGDERSIDVNTFKSRVQGELLPLTHSKQEIPSYSNDYQPELRDRYESIRLDEDHRGDVADYYENIYQSPIENTTGSIHFDNPRYNKNSPIGYFAHTRVEDLAGDYERIPPKPGEPYGSLGKQLPGDTRRIIEIQSDLFQRGRLDREKGMIVDPEAQKMNEELARRYSAAREDAGEFGDQAEVNAIAKEIEEFEHAQAVKREAELGPLNDYKNTWYERIIREETQQAAADGKSTIQVPTGETAMRVEGLAGEVGQVPENLNEGDLFEYGGEDYRILDWYMDGEIRVIPERYIERTFDFDSVRQDEINSVADDLHYDLTHDKDQGDWKTLEGRIPDEQWEFLKKHNGDVDAYDKEFPDGLAKAAEADIDARYTNAEEFAQYMSDNTGEDYRAYGDEILYFGRNSNDYSEMMRAGSDDLDIDTDSPIYKFYQDEVGKYVKKRYGAEEVTDENGVTWWQYSVPKEAASQPVEAFGAALLPLATIPGATANTTPQTLPQHEKEK